MKTSKIKHIQDIVGDGVKWNGIYYHNLEMENGDKINIGKAKKQEIGWELNYEETGDGQHEYNKAKAVNPEFSSNAQPKGGDLKGIKIGHAITNAVQLTIHDKSFIDNNATGEQIIKSYARMILKIGEELNNDPNNGSN